MSRASFRRRLELSLWLLGGALVLGFGLHKTVAARAQATAIAELEGRWLAASSDAPDQSQWSESRKASHARSASHGERLTPVALIRIPAVGVEAAVFEGTSDRVLDLGIGRLQSSAGFGQDGNVALAGHRDGFFRNLKDVGIGDVIEVRHGRGLDRFEVAALQIVEPQDVSVLAPSEDSRMTLITCYPFYVVGSAPKRFIVHAVRKLDEEASLKKGSRNE